MGKDQKQIAHARSSAVLVVYPNVYAVADHLGRLSAAVRYDPDHGKSGVVHFVGVEMQRTPRPGFVREELKERGVRQTIYDTTFKHSLEQQRVPHTDYIKRQIRDGSLIPANEETARLGGVKFVDPNTALAQAREKLHKEMVTLYGEAIADEWAANWPIYRIGEQKESAEATKSDGEVGANSPPEVANQESKMVVDGSEADSEKPSTDVGN